MVEKVVQAHLSVLAEDLLKAISHRYTAALNAELPDQSDTEKWYSMANRVSAGDLSAVTELIHIAGEMWDKNIERHNEWVAKRSNLESKLANLKRRVDNVRYLSITLQVLGILAVLAKDLPYQSNESVRSQSFSITNGVSKSNA